MNTVRLLYLILLLSYCYPILYAQGSLHQAINSAGGEATGEQGSATYSIGQLVYSSFKNTNMHVAGGVQQAAPNDQLAFKIDKSKADITITAYPNPVLDHVVLRIKYSDIKNLAYQLYDVHGRLVKKERVYKAQTTIALDYLQPATYLLNVLEKGKTLKILKLIKS